MRKFFSHLALCITAILVIALCGCEDLGEFADVEEYYSSFGDIVVINGITREKEEYSVDEYFYSEESRDDFLVGEDGEYMGITPGEYVYVAIPFESDINMESFALYIKATEDVSLYINVYLTDSIPSNFRSLGDNPPNGSTPATGGQTEEKIFDDPDPETRVSEVKLYLNKEKWGSFLVEAFLKDGSPLRSLEIKDGQYLLLQIRNNSGVRVYNEDLKAYVDPETGLPLNSARITMTNLLVRTLDQDDGE
jgi:hypothetical protein